MKIVSLALEQIQSGEQVVILTHRREHCAEIARLLASHGVASGLMLGGADYSAEFEYTRSRLVDGSLRVAVGTLQAIGQALDIPSLGVAFVSTPSASNILQFGQIIGRVCRIAKGKKSAKLIYLWDKRVYGKKALSNLKSWNNDVKVLSNSEWKTVPDYLSANR
jgi:superfamily II DNA or RNA helicase